MSIFTTVPRLFGKGIHIWFGLVLLVLITIQLITGLGLARDTAPIGTRGFHELNGYLISAVAVVHAYFGVGLWFFGFKYKKPGRQ